MADNRNNENKMERIPVSGLRDIMTVLGKDPNFAYRWVVDEDEKGSRILRFKRGGWEFARNDDQPGGVQVGSESVYKSRSEGSIIREHSGAGRFSYLMKIRKEFYDEDQAAKAKEIDEVEETIVGTGSSEGTEFGQYGSIKIER